MARYTPDELEQWLWVESIADTAAPTASELAAGVNIMCPVGSKSAIASVSGFGFTVGTAETPDMCSRFTTTIPARSSAEAGSIEFYMDDDPASTVRDALERDAVGNIVRVHPVSGAKAPLVDGTIVEVWPVQITGNNVNSPAPGEPAKFTVGFSHPAPPQQFAEIGAGS
jgi:hypothetical protein